MKVYLKNINYSINEYRFLASLIWGEEVPGLEHEYFGHKKKYQFVNAPEPKWQTITQICKSLQELIQKRTSSEVEFIMGANEYRVEK